MSRLKCEGDVQEAYDQRRWTRPSFFIARGRACRNES
jgi:hypothetical protein